MATINFCIIYFRAVAAGICAGWNNQTHSYSSYLQAMVQKDLFHWPLSVFIPLRWH